MLTEGRCTLAVDIGGTFTDVVLQVGGAAGVQSTSLKVLTTPDAPERGFMDGMRAVLDESGCQPAQLDLIIHGTTLATNALIERRGARTALLTTRGFRDILEMGYEKRYAHYDLDAPMPSPLVPRTLRFEVSERVRAGGAVLDPLDEGAVRTLAGQLREAEIEALAIGFLHAYANPVHEQRAAELLRQALPDLSVSLSCDVCPEMREYERFSTTCANAYVQPLMAGYLGRLRGELDDCGVRCPLFMMMSGGGLTTLEQAMLTPIRLVESGPAGGAILAANIASARGIARAMAFDMGGTTAKICLIDDGQPERSRRFEVAREYRDMKGSGLPLRIPVIEMVEIGAGGGSIASLDAMQRIAVGPRSAGATPGPVAYARGGEHATVTDANLVLGKLDPDHFAGGTLTLDAEAAHAALATQLGAPLKMNAEWAAAGVAGMVEENMANAARVHAVERGKEASEYTLVAFGGGAPLHATALARKLGIARVVVPHGAGVGSAIGFLSAPVGFELVRSYRATLDTLDLTALNALLSETRKRVYEVVRAGAGEAPLSEARGVELRYLGQGHELAVGLPARALTTDDLASLRARFETRYRDVYGLDMPDVEVEAVSWSVGIATHGEPLASVPMPEALRDATPVGTRRMFDPEQGSAVDAPEYSRPTLQRGDRIPGPALISERETTTVVPAGASAVVDAGNAIVIDLPSAQRE